jgi:hypothetical protein
MTSQEPTRPPPPVQSKIAKSHSKSDTSHSLQTVVAASDREDRVQILTERIDVLEKALDSALQENKRLLAELKQKRKIEEKLEDEKSLTAVLTLITEAAGPLPE